VSRLFSRTLDTLAEDFLHVGLDIAGQVVHGTPIDAPAAPVQAPPATPTAPPIPSQDLTLNDILATVTRPAPAIEPQTNVVQSVPTPVAPTTNIGLSEAIAAIEPVNTKIVAEIMEGNFLDWAKSYTGPKFNFIHCDFPYGIGHGTSDLGKAKRWGSYDDSKDVYVDLIKCLIEHRSKFIAHSAHIMLWFSMNYYQLTIDAFKEAFGDDIWIDLYPLIWYKSDNLGILPDPKRGPRRIYETALIFSLGDRKIVKAVSNVCAAPSDKELHISQKSNIALMQFMSMFVDSNSRVLDPTCGSGSAIKVARRLGASYSLGIEKDPNYAKEAKTSLNMGA
jgi:hypothetical protein